MGVYYATLEGTLQSVAQVSAKLDGFGWDGGWRINDNAQQTLWMAEDGQGNWLFSGTPSVWVINAITMEIVVSEWDSMTVDAFSVVQNIDNNY